MNLKDELKKIDEFFENISAEEFDNMLIRNGVENSKYKVDADTTFHYKKYSEYENFISKIKRQQDEYVKISNNQVVSNLYNNLNLGAA